jgi:hypothetical protein
VAVFGIGSSHDCRQICSATGDGAATGENFSKSKGLSPSPVKRSDPIVALTVGKGRSGLAVFAPLRKWRPGIVSSVERPGTKQGTFMTSFHFNTADSKNARI